MKARTALFIGRVDIGGTAIRAAPSDREGTVIQRMARPTRIHERPWPLIGRTKEAVRQAAVQYLIDAWGIAIACTSTPNTREGVIIKAPGLVRWEHALPKALLQNEFGLSVHQGNLARLAALAEQHFEAGRETTNLVYVTHSPGVGGSVIIDGRILLGSKALGAEAAHIVPDLKDPRCRRGNTGC